jgi:hypothetical protein
MAQEVAGGFSLHLSLVLVLNPQSAIRNPQFHRS